MTLHHPTPQKCPSHTKENRIPGTTLLGTGLTSNPEQPFASKDMLKAGVCKSLLNTLHKGVKEGDRTAQLQPHMPEGLASTVVVTQRDIDITAEAFTKKVLKNFTMGVLNYDNSRISELYF